MALGEGSEWRTLLLAVMRITKEIDLQRSVFRPVLSPTKRPPKLSSRDKRALQERPPAVGPGLLRSTLARGGPGAGAGPSSVASDDSSDDDGWRREPGADEVREHYMDSKFGGEGADMSDIVMG